MAKYIIDENELLIAIKSSLNDQLLTAYDTAAQEIELSVAAMARNIAMAAMGAGIEMVEGEEQRKGRQAQS